MMSTAFRTADYTSPDGKWHPRCRRQGKEPTCTMAEEEPVVQSSNSSENDLDFDEVDNYIGDYTVDTTDGADSDCSLERHHLSFYC